MATAAALLSHLAGGGAAPGWLGLVVPWALSLTVCTALAGRRVALWRTVVSVALSQVLFHTLFVLGATAAVAPAGHAAHGGYTLPAPAAGADPSPYLPDLLLAGPAMWLWHGVAAAVTVAALYGGERLLDRLREQAARLAGRLRRALPSRADVAPPAPVVRVAVPDWFTGSFPARPEVSPSRRRGPPLPRAT
ncbi:hypothetical protein APR03_004342 [Promicromonospora thailandica]|uniref:Uncharacterized protein n=1 Tax=Promicromonospora thailandica TaxID=765201 RepID=A0A9X2JWU2_9MICO|nr:hypothetical protein [Promicromonospora thailandica]